MKFLLPIAFLLLLVNYNAAAQRTRLDSMLQKRANPEEPGVPLKDVIKHIGTDVYVRDTVVNYKIANSSLKLLYLGGKYPNQILTIIIKGKRLNKQTANWLKSGIGYFSGKAIIYQGKPAIVIASMDQLDVRIAI